MSWTGPERARGELHIAGAPQHSHTWTRRLYEALDECGLADARLAADEGHAAVPRERIGQSGLELAQAAFAFQELHDRPAACQRRRGYHAIPAPLCQPSNVEGCAAKYRGPAPMQSRPPGSTLARIMAASWLLKLSRLVRESFSHLLRAA